MSTLIVVPMKDPRASKTRLAASLAAPSRERLAKLFYRRTLAFLAPVAAQAGAGLAVVTGSPAVAAIAADAGIPVIAESGQGGLSGAARDAARWAGQAGNARLCIIPADLAAPEAADMHKLLASQADVTICPAEDRGTNALLLAPPNAIPFCYGPRSALHHLAEAEARGLNAVMMPLESLSFDIDTTVCLTRAARAQPELAELAGWA